MKIYYRNVYYTSDGRVERGMSYSRRRLVPPMHLMPGFIGVESVSEEGAVIFLRRIGKNEAQKQWLGIDTSKTKCPRERYAAIRGV
jgi:hypothetical protein